MEIKRKVDISEGTIGELKDVAIENSKKFYKAQKINGEFVHYATT